MNSFTQKIWNVLDSNDSFTTEQWALTRLMDDVFHVNYDSLTALDVLHAVEILTTLHHHDDGESAPDITDFL